MLPRFVVLERRNDRSTDLAALRNDAQANALPSSSHVDIDMEDSDSASSMSDEDRHGLDLDNVAPLETSPSSNFASHMASAVATPGPYGTWNNAGAVATTQGFPFTTNTQAIEARNHQGFGVKSLPATNNFIDPTVNGMPSILGDFDLGSIWNMTDSNPARMEGNPLKEGEGGEDRRTSTLTLKDVQPQMVSRIIKMLYESKAAVNIEISSEN